MNVRLLQVAQQEVDEAVSHYNSESPGLGEEIRRCRLRRFPYGLIYVIEEGNILVLALAHAKRQPRYWQERMRR